MTTRLITTADEAPNWHPAESPEAQAILAEAAKRAVRETPERFDLQPLPTKPEPTRHPWALAVHTDRGEEFRSLASASRAMCGNDQGKRNISNVLDKPDRKAYDRRWFRKARQA